MERHKNVAIALKIFHIFSKNIYPLLFLYQKVYSQAIEPNNTHYPYTTFF